jgi:hypothetical protein
MMFLSRHSRGGANRPARRSRYLAAVAAAAVLAVLGAVPAAAATAGDAGSPPKVKYYIVQPASHGHQQFLYEIAAQTLGNSNLYTEIFQMNKGRLQPDGGRLEVPTSIDPGWILVLPATASGPGVHYGPLPAVRAPNSQPTTSASPAMSTPSQTAPAAAAVGSPGQGTSREIILGAIFIALVALVGVATSIGRRGRTSTAVLAPAAAPDAPRPEPPTRPSRTSVPGVNADQLPAGLAAPVPFSAPRQPPGSTGITQPWPSPLPPVTPTLPADSRTAAGNTAGEPASPAPAADQPEPIDDLRLPDLINPPDPAAEPGPHPASGDAPWPDFLAAPQRPIR